MSNEKDNFWNLTSREAEIVRLIIDGSSTTEVAKQLDLSPRTIETHKRNMFLKCRVNSSVELIVFVMKNGFYKQMQVA